MQRKPLSLSQKKVESLEGLENRLQYSFKDSTLLTRALNHPSAGGKFFQRFEFLGDRVLGLSIAQWLYEAFPQDPEGHLSKRLANMVNRGALNRVAQSLHLSHHILSDTAMAYNGRVMADACEAVLGAIYLDGGLLAVQKVVRILWKPLWDEQEAAASMDAKSALQEYLQGEKSALPVYTLMAQSGPSHHPLFQIRLETDRGDSFVGQGASKREAEQRAAQCALDYYLGSMD